MPTPAEDAVAKVKAAFAAKAEAPADAPAEKKAEAPKKAAPKKTAAKTAYKVEKAAEKASEPAPVSKAKPEAKVEAAETVSEKAPETLKQARDGKPDDLKKLKGVGPKLEATLHELGFFHFDQVASWGPGEVAWVDSRLKFKGRIERDGWIEQAKLLASGGETEFSKRVEAGEVASSKSED